MVSAGRPSDVSTTCRLLGGLVRVDVQRWERVWLHMHTCTCVSLTSLYVAIVTACTSTWRTCRCMVVFVMVLGRVRVRVKRLVNEISLLNKKKSNLLKRVSVCVRLVYCLIIHVYNNIIIICDASFVVIVYVMNTLTSSTCRRYDSTAGVVRQATCCSSTRARSAATSRTSRCCRTSTPACSSPSTSHPTTGCATWSSCTCLTCCLVRRLLYMWVTICQIES